MNHPPPYSVCVNQDVFNLKKELQDIENEIQKTESNNPKRPKLRRRAADLEELIINIEQTKCKESNIVSLLNKNIEILSEYVESESSCILNERIWDSFCKCSQTYFTRSLDLIDYLKKQFPLYEKLIETVGNEAYKIIEDNPANGANPPHCCTLTSEINNILRKRREKAIKHMEDIKPELYRKQLDFNKSLLELVKNIINEKDNLNNKINKQNEDIKILYDCMIKKGYIEIID